MPDYKDKMLCFIYGVSPIELWPCSVFTMYNKGISRRLLLPQSTGGFLCFSFQKLIWIAIYSRISAKRYELGMVWWVWCACWHCDQQVISGQPIKYHRMLWFKDRCVHSKGGTSTGRSLFQASRSLVLGKALSFKWQTCDKKVSAQVKTYHIFYFFLKQLNRTQVFMRPIYKEE